MKPSDIQLNKTSIPKIKAGGSSSSEILNQFFQAFNYEMVDIKGKILDYQSTSENYDLINTIQTLGLQTMAASFNTRLQVLAASGDLESVNIDMADGANIGVSTFDRKGHFNQVTLPIKQSIDLLKTFDVYGNVVVPDDIKLSYGISPTLTEPIYTEAPEGKKVLAGESHWLLDWPTGYPTTSTLFIKLDVPIQYQGHRPNVLELTMLPIFTGKIKAIQYRSTLSGSFGTWNSLDLSYLPGYDPELYNNYYVNQPGALRVFLPDTEISSIRIQLEYDDETSWGLSSISLKSVEFEANGTLVIQNPLGNIDTISIRGKDNSSLQDLNYSINNNSATIQLSSNDPKTSPIVTNVLVRTS